MENKCLRTRDDESIMLMGSDNVLERDEDNKNPEDEIISTVTKESSLKYAEEIMILTKSDPDPAVATTIPDVAILWILRNDCASNVQLGNMSNVNKNWRALCVEVVTLETRLWIRDGISPNVKKRLKPDKARSWRASAVGVVENDAVEQRFDNFHLPGVGSESFQVNEVVEVDEGVTKNTARMKKGNDNDDLDLGEDALEDRNQSQEQCANMEETSIESFENCHNKINCQFSSHHNYTNTANSSHRNHHHNGNQHYNLQQNISQGKCQNQTSPIRRLFLTDMARELLTRQHHYRHLQKLGIRDSIIRHFLNHQQRHNHHLPRHDHQSQQNRQHDQSLPFQDAKKSIGEIMVNIDGNFCLGWFAPSGIQVMSVDVDVEGREEINDGARRNGSCRGGGSESVTCCYEWRGYRHAMEVLVPFGYATEFVRNVLDAVSEQDSSDNAPLKTPEDELTAPATPSTHSTDLPPLPSFPYPTNTNKRTLARSSSELSQSRLSKISSHIYNPTFAVRGATLARAEGFCLCMETDFPLYSELESRALPLPYTFQGPNAWMNTRGKSTPFHPSSVGTDRPIQSQILTKRQNLAKVLLPRMILSTRRKNPLLHRFAEADEDGNYGQKHPSVHDPHSNKNSHHSSFPWEKRQRSVQFLNSDRSQAVRLITTPFQCGPIRAPLTMFIIAIATEDGCFVSGKNSRFELGHLHPFCSDDMRYDTSPVCIATEKEKKREYSNTMLPSTLWMDLLADLANGRDSQDGNATDCGSRGVLDSAAPKTRAENQGSDTAESDSSSIDDDDSESSGNDRTLPCHCKFESNDPFVAGDLDVDGPSEAYVRRGGTGPGQWHCYVAVFDGENSMIRVDGREEPQRTSRYYGSDTRFDDDDEDHPDKAGTLVGSGILDGLSIGSDHQFDMSLCYGDVEGQGGEGAISELAVFKGRMEVADIEQMEKYLMQKHGLLSIDEQEKFVSEQNSTRSKAIRIVDHLQEEEWRRKAHALIQQSPPWDLEVEPIPLRVAANHKSVAWHRKDDVTGKVLSVSRIGNKLSNGSSDW
mmetsp:Transcript_31879/g.66144  ORF Transcript_31879/g.66144 Transcript_31879/m.66144 type:complete len:1040 (-) Transcript_31879:1933-5052(-)